MSEIAYHEPFTEREYDVQVYEHRWTDVEGQVRTDIRFGDFYKKGEQPTHYEYDIISNKHIGVAHIKIDFEPKKLTKK